MTKKCSKCNIDKPLTEFSLRKEVGKKGSYTRPRADCKKCVAKRSKEYIRKKKEAIIARGGHDYNIIYQNYFKCPKCNSNKLGKFFYKTQEHKTGLSVYCKSCDKKYAQDRMFARKHEYTEEQLAMIMRECKICKKTRPLGEYHRSHSSKSGRRINCKFCINKKNQKRRSSKKGRLGVYKEAARGRKIEWNLSDEEFFSFWQSDCSYCGDKIATIGVDRVDNTKAYSVDNVRSCCIVCNRMKMAMGLDEWLSHMRKIIKNSDKQ
jgi:transcription elongation factor Elf1